MFFVLSKILAFVITPIVWVVGLIIWALISKDALRRKKLLYVALGLILFFSNGFIFDEAARLWEVPATPIEQTSTYDYGIVLGGMSSYDPTLQRAQFFRGIDRLVQAVELYRKGKIKKILFTGGSGSISHPEAKEGNYVNRYLLYMGIPQEDFIMETESQNTHENAVMTKAILDARAAKGPYLLITSAFHMRRSLKCFEKVGMTVVPYSTDRYAGPRKYDLDFLFIPNVSYMNDWNNLLHEWTGYVTYRLAGYL